MQKTETFTIYATNVITSFDRIADVRSNHLSEKFIVSELSPENWYFRNDDFPFTIINFVNITNAIDTFFMTNINTFPLTCVEITLSGALSVTYTDDILSENSSITSTGSLELRLLAAVYNDVPEPTPPEDEE